MTIKLSRLLIQSVVAVALVVGCLEASGQIPLLPHPRRQEQRYSIDAKRTGTDPNSDDALPRSREFKRMDETYYVGWLYEGSYRYNHAADYAGFKNAEAPLLQCLALMERDYGKLIRTRSSDLMTSYPAYRFQLDYTMAAYYLTNCYSNTEQPQKVVDLANRVKAMNLQRDWYMDVYNQLAWTVHRTRGYTKSKSAFLTGDLAGNEALALRYLDSGLQRISRNNRINVPIFGPGYDAPEKLGVYHYKAMIYSYGLEIDSAQRYYDLLRSGGLLSHNNYATFKTICGDFRTAEDEYKLEAASPQTDKRLEEQAYFLPMLYNYKGQPELGEELARDKVKANGSTPGYGWYNIARARSLLYSGQIANATIFLNKAANFRELHLGTTLGQPHYEFSIQILRLMRQINAMEAVSFEDRNWWYHPGALTKLAGMLSERYQQQFLIISQFAQNPERDKVVYRLFSTESTVGWDEIWFLIRDFTTAYFKGRFRQLLATDKRPGIRRYYRYFLGRLELAEGHPKEAELLFREVLKDPELDEEFEKLLIARCLQGLALGAEQSKDTRLYYRYMYEMYAQYPQLIPHSGLKMGMRMITSGSVDKQVVERLNELNISWNANEQAPIALLRFEQRGAEKRVIYKVQDAEGRIVVPEKAVVYKDARSGGLSVGYGLFKVKY
jgi:hypothetical protein